MKKIKSGTPLIILGVIIVFIVFLLFTKPTETITSQTEVDTETEKAFSPSLKVPTQVSSNLISVESAMLEKPGFIAVYKTMEKELPDENNFRGVSGILEGSQANIEIPLREESAEGDSYSVVIHIDDGDKLFEFPGDDQPDSFSDGTVNYVRTTIGAASPKNAGE